MAKKKTDPLVERALTESLDDTKHGITVAFNGEDAFEVAFEYDRDLVALMHGIQGAEFKKEQGMWVVPVAQYDAMATARDKLFKAGDKVMTDKADLENRLAATLNQIRKNNPETEIADVVVSDFHPQDKVIVGEIVNANGSYALQFTGIAESKQAGDGVLRAYVVRHRQSDLERPVVFKGDDVVIGYNKEGRRAEVSESARSVEKRFEENLAKEVDGVKVIESDGKYLVSFDYNPTLTARIQRIDGAEFEKESKVWQVGTDKHEFVVRAVNDMRREVVADRSDRESITAIASEKIDGAKVKDAYIKDGQSYSGQVLAKNDRYVLQHTGKEYATLHRTAALDKTPEVGTNLKVAYSVAGRATVMDKSQDRSQSQGRA